MTNGAVILDVDGTLVDSNDAHARAWVEALAEHGITVPFQKVRRAIGMGGDKLLPDVAGIAEDSTEGQKVARRRAAIFKESYLPHIRPFPGARTLLERFLADGLQLSVASSAKEEELEALLQIAGADDLISAQTSSDDAANSKPDPDIVVAAIARVRVDRQRIIMLGDTPYDVQAATRAGIRIVALECGGWTAGDLRGALAIFQSPEDLLRRYDESPFAQLTSLTSRTF
jgi:phosphoglycolate phosphatase-like HAD superfamily hydrolase